MAFSVHSLLEVLPSSEDKVIDYTYISDDNFLLILFLTAQGRLLTYHQSAGTVRKEARALESVSDQECVPVLITITDDAKIVVLLLRGGGLHLVPIRCLMDVHWGAPCALSEPLRVDLGYCDVGRSLRIPTSAVTFRSRHTSRQFVVFSNRSGSLYVVDLMAPTSKIWIPLNRGGIERVELLELDGISHVLVTCEDDAQLIIPMETKEMSSRETLSQIESATPWILDGGVRHTCQNQHGLVSAVNGKSQKIELYWPQFLAAPVYRVEYDAPSANCWPVYCSKKMVVAVSGSSTLFVHLPFIQIEEEATRYIRLDATSGCEILGFVPLTDGEEGMANCLMVYEDGLFELRPERSTEDIVAHRLCELGFPTEVLNGIASKLSVEPASLCRTVLRSVLQNKEVCERSVDGAISMALGLNMRIEEVFDLLCEFNAADYLIPFLAAQCEKTQDRETPKKLFKAYMTQLSKFPQCEANKERRDSIEEDLKQFLVKCDISLDILLSILNESLWSCVALVLSRNSHLCSPAVANFLLKEVPSWRSLRLTDVINVLAFLSWSSLDSLVPACSLVAKILPILPTADCSTHLSFFVDLGHTLLSRGIESAISVYTAASALLLQCRQQDPELRIRPKELSCGPNCTAAVTDEHVLFWGEFSAGNVRMRSDNTVSKTNSLKRKPDGGAIYPGGTSLQRSSLFRKSQELQKFPIPKNLPLPVDGNSFQVRSVCCGTEHVLVLTSEGSLFSWGRNRFGQCGVGNNEVVGELTRVTGNWGCATAVFAGHYHSALINEHREVWTWGWGLHGQLATGDCWNHSQPTKVSISTDFEVTDIVLGYAHSLFLLGNGSVLGCGTANFGQLGSDPVQQRWDDSVKSKRLRVVPFPEPIRLIASSYYHGIAVGARTGALYQWGECPQTLRLRMYLLKRKRISGSKSPKDKSAATALRESLLNAVDSAELVSSPAENTNRHMELDRDHMNVSKLCDWELAPITAISAGFNHSALITADGKLFTWGRGQQMQLGHDNKKDRNAPTEINEPSDVRWIRVECACTSTTAVTSDGRVFVWGRNDKSQLGIGVRPKRPGAARRLVYNASKGQQSVELPDDNCVATPTAIPGVHVVSSPSDNMPANQLREDVEAKLATTDQLTLNALSRFLLKHQAESLLTASVHLHAGDILHATDQLAIVWQDSSVRNRTQVPQASAKDNCGNPLRHSSISCGNSSSAASTSVADTSYSYRTENVSSFQANSSQSSSLAEGRSAQSASSSALRQNGAPTNAQQFDAVLERAWCLLRVHPVRDVQTATILKMLSARLPVYTRLSQDARLCRLLDPYLNLDRSSSTSGQPRKISELGVRERIDALKSARLPSLKTFSELRSKCERSLTQLRFYAECGHYERNIVESGPTKQELAAARNKARKCTRCVVRKPLS